MQSRYILEERDGTILLHDKSKYYTLFIGIENRVNPPLDDFPVEFRVRHGYNEPVSVTCRNKKEYPKEIRELEINPVFQYIEVGAGLAEFIPSIISEWNGKLLHMPIIIDPADYQLMQDMLLHAKDIYVDKPVKERLEVILERASIILDPTKVRLVNTTLGQALLRYSWLEEIANVVIDFNGANMYFEPYDRCSTGVANMELESRMKNLERWLLKPRGVLLSYVSD